MVYKKKHFQTIIQFQRHRHRCILISRDDVRKTKSINRKVRRVESPEINPCLQFDYFNKLSLFGRKENKLFYFYEQFNQGVHYLIGLSQYNLNNIASLLNTDEVNCHFQLAYLFVTMNPNQIEIETEVLRYFHSNLSPSFLGRKWVCSLPMDIPTVRRLYLEGKNSILKNLPHPGSISIEGHSYVSLTEIVQDCLANDVSYCDLSTCNDSYDENNVTHICDSKFVKDLVTEVKSNNQPKTKHIMIVRWSGDFEPNNVKKNKGNSIWTFTVTLISGNNHRHSEKNTYIVSLGPKNSNHECI